MSTYNDWNPVNVDLLSCCEISHFIGVPLAEIWKWVAFDQTFPQYRRDANGCRKFRWPDIVELLDGARNQRPREARP